MPTANLKSQIETQTRRDERMRSWYAMAASQQIPRLLGAIDRNPYRPTYGCLDRQFWHYRTSDFPSEMYQEGAWPLTLAYTHPFPGNRWHGEPRVRELAIAALRFSARSCHRDGSCDDYYLYERALGAAVFSLVASAQTYRLLQLDDAEILSWLMRRADWVANHDESGRLSNHHALAALGLLQVAQITGEQRYRDAAEKRLRKVLSWQSEEGWFDEYGGADPGYQTVTLDCLVKCQRLVPPPLAASLANRVVRGVQFCHLFLHPDSSYGGEYGSRGTYHFYPHGFELLASENAAASDLADGFLQSLAARKQAFFDDDRLVAHRLGNLIEAYVDWSPKRAVAEPAVKQTEYLAEAKLLIHRTEDSHTVISAARGGVFKHFDSARRSFTDAGLMVQLDDGRLAVSQSHDLTRDVQYHGRMLTVSGPLQQANFETLSPLKLIVLRLFMLLVGRWRRTLVRRLLQKRLITGRAEAPLRLTRSFEFRGSGRLRVRDEIEITDPRIRVRRMSFGTDHQAAYVAASGVYQESVLQPWHDLAPQVDELNQRRRIAIVREW